MNSQRTRYMPKIDKILVFNNEWAHREGSEINKLIYYYNGTNATNNNDESLNWETNGSLDEINNGLLFNCDQDELRDATNIMGVSEAMISFVKNFGKDEEIYSVHGTKVRLSLRELEPNYWLSMSLTLPKTLIAPPGSKENTNKEQQYIEYHDEEFNDHLVQMIIRQMYETFYLFHGSFQSIWTKSENNLNQLRSVVFGFFAWYLTSLKLSTINLIELFGAIQYLPADHSTYMTAQSFVNHVLSCDPSCKHILFLFNEQLISSTLDLNNTRIIYRYLTSLIIPEVAAEEMSESVRSKTLKKTRFIRQNVKIHIHGEDMVYLMNVYRSINGATVVLLLDDQQDYPYDQVLSKCDVFMSERLPELASKLGEISVIGISTLENSTLASYSSSLSNPNSANLGTSSSLSSKADHHHHTSFAGDLFRFAYFNESNAAFKSNAGFNGILDHRKLSDSEFVKLIIDVKSDLRTHLSLLPLGEGKNLIEIVAKTTNESWFVANETDARTLLCMLNHKNDNLVEAAETVSGHISRRFKNFLFLD